MNLLERVVHLMGINPNKPSNQELQELHSVLEKGRIYKRAERYADALDTLAKGASLPAAEKDPNIMTLIDLNRADIYIRQRRWDDAAALLEGLETRTLVDLRRMAYVLNVRGVLAQERGDWETARTYYERARRIAQENEVEGAEGRAAGHLADTYLHEGNASYSVHLLREGLEKLHNSGDLELSSYFTGRLGEALIATGQVNEGRQLLGKALRMAKHMRYRVYERRWHLLLAEQAMAIYNYDSARTHYLQALSKVDETHARDDYVVLLCRLSKACLRLREYEDALGYARRAVEFSETLDPTMDAHYMAQGALGVVLRSLIQYQTAIPYLEVAVTGYETISTTHSDYSYVDILRNLAACKAEVSAVESALTIYEQALTVTAQAEMPLERAGTYRDLGILHAAQGNTQAAMENWTYALDIYDQEGDHASTARIYSDMANLRREQGEYDWAMRDVEKALTVINHADDPETKGIVLANAAVAYIDRGDIDTAEDFLVNAIKIARDIDDRRAEAMRRGNYGWLLLSTGRAERALETLDYARQQSAILQLDLAVAVQTDNIGLAYSELHQYEQAVNYHQQAIEHLTRIDAPYWEAIARANLGHALISLGQIDDAVYHLSRALDAGREHDYKEVIAHALTAQARIAFQRGNLDLMGRLIDEAVSVARATRERRLLADALTLQSRYQASNGGVERAGSTWAEARDLYTVLRLSYADMSPEWLNN